MKKTIVALCAALTVVTMPVMPVFAADGFVISPTVPDEPISELPDPNDPDSPDEITIMDEEGVPRTYLKVQNPDGSYESILISEDEISLINVEVESPQTDDHSSFGWIVTASGLVGVSILAFSKSRKSKAD